MSRHMWLPILLLCVCVSLSACTQDTSGIFSSIKTSNMLTGKASVYYEKGQYQKAVYALKDAIKARPENGRAHYLLAEIYIKLESTEEAVAVLESYLEYMAQTDEYVTDLEKDYTRKCRDLLGSL